ncbi:hypothetical protein N7510_004695 [Penicillium lagena]|uniref:uncharacterized protein n=1 Tax=Penicillium lagena TaxID=94218 RepID=UPI002540AC37|nr:uncharacterized protein N7510_004695 [Penicillium lagena]KAJ5620711.1 hypothetical protein N7510_004695 [Penicillium lagena]
MPLFTDPDRRQESRWSGDHDLESPAPGSPLTPAGRFSHGQRESPVVAETAAAPIQPTTLNPLKLWTNEREELIHRIKESSPWRLQRGSPEVSHNSGMPHNSTELKTVEEQAPEWQHPKVSEELESPADIQRPRSALHSGDFSEGATPDPPQSPQALFAERRKASPFPLLGTSPTTPWFGPPAFPTPLRRPNALGDCHEGRVAVETRSRAPSMGSFSSSYVLKTPTSPLVHQANNTDLDFSPQVDVVEVPGPSDRTNRRRTLPPETFRHLESSPPASRVVNPRGPCPPGRREDLFPLQPSSPRRSLTSAYSLQLASPGQNPISRARRPSLTSDISAKPHAPLVGSYEESILRGRMSMNPSKPLDFTAQIGVLGKGKCKAHLKCPPHVTVPFPAVFYSYPTSGSGRSISDDNPSPYVGQIDLENSLPRDELNTTRRRKRRASPATVRKDHAAEDVSTRILNADTIRRRGKKSRRAESPKRPPGGCYRIPQQGQLQIMIKNPHKTAVKLFLVPYDLSDMEPGTKTFIRQRSYSAGPILDMPLNARKNFGTDRPEASLNISEDPKDKPVLRYLVHLNVCCPARGRFFLHSSIRVVFANRVPDGKESLRNEIQLPEPRYSPYKPSRDSTLLGSVGARTAIENASRRRSAGHGTIPPLLRPHVSSPSDPPPQWDVPGSAHFAQNNPKSSDGNMYSKLNKGDVGYGGYPFPALGEGSEIPESLLAKRLRGLDVHKHDLERQGQGTKPSTSTR